MFRFIIFFISVLISLYSISQNIPYPQLPDWESNSNSHRATGLGLADIDNDGWKDLIVANGNDMAIQNLVVYYNQGDGTFPLDPDWSSEDTDYHGHLAVGDINKDGWIDVAVSVYIGQEGFSEPGKVKVYYNEGGELESSPSFVSNPFYTFSCAFGDADGDGDLDLATTGGEPYGGIYDEGKVFLNRNGTFSETPEWESSTAFGSLDVDFGDVDQNGFLDLIFSCEETDNYIFLADENGEISTEFNWESSDATNYINSIDFGFVGSDHIPGIVMTGNDQLGGDGKVRLYDFETAVPATSSASWTSNTYGYGSGILLSDVDLDGILDLIYGGWWLPVKIALGDDNGFETTTSYTSSTSSVVETIQIADLDKDGIESNTESFSIDSDNISVIYLEKQLIENILSIKLNGIEVSQSFYCVVPNKNWISFNDNLNIDDEIIVEYEYSESGDIVITNWDSNKGNYIFYNEPTSTGISNAKTSDNQTNFSIHPNPTCDRVMVEFELSDKALIEIVISDLLGKNTIKSYRSWEDIGKHNKELDLTHLNKGIYLLEFKSQNYSESRKLIIK